MEKKTSNPYLKKALLVAFLSTAKSVYLRCLFVALQFSRLVVREKEKFFKWNSLG